MVFAHGLGTSGLHEEAHRILTAPWIYFRLANEDGVVEPADIEPKYALVSLEKATEYERGIPYRSDLDPGKLKDKLDDFLSRNVSEFRRHWSRLMFSGKLVVPTNERYEQMSPKEINDLYKDLCAKEGQKAIASDILEQLYTLGYIE